MNTVGLFYHLFLYQFAQPFHAIFYYSSFELFFLRCAFDRCPTIARIHYIQQKSSPFLCSLSLFVALYVSLNRLFQQEGHQCKNNKMITCTSYENKNQKQLQLLCSNSARVMLRLCESMLEFCLQFLALIQQQGKLEILLRLNLALIQQQWKL